MKNSKIKSSKNLNFNRNLNYKVISLTSLSTLALSFTLGNMSAPKAITGNSGTVRFYGSNSSRVIKPSNMGSTGSGKVKLPSIGNKVTSSVNSIKKPTTSTGNKTYTSKLHVNLDSNGNIKAPNSTGGSKPSSSIGTQTNKDNKLPSSSVGTQTNGDTKLPSSSVGTQTNGITNKNPNLKEEYNKDSISNHSNHIYDDVDNTNNTTTSKHKLTKKQKVGLITGGAIAGIGALAGIGIGVGVGNNNKNNSSSENTQGPSTVPTPSKPTNTTRVVQSGAGFLFTDEKAK